MKNRQIQIGGKVAAAPKFHVPPQLWWLATGPLRRGSPLGPSATARRRTLRCRPARRPPPRARGSPSPPPVCACGGSPPPLPQRAARSYNKKEERKRISLQERKKERISKRRDEEGRRRRPRGRRRKIIERWSTSLDLGC